MQSHAGSLVGSSTFHRGRSNVRSFPRFDGQLSIWTGTFLRQARNYHQCTLVGGKTSWNNLAGEVDEITENESEGGGARSG